MLRRKLFSLVTLAVFVIMYNSLCYGDNGLSLVSYETRSPITMDLSKATVVEATEENSEVVEKLKEIEESSQNTDVSESVWLVLVPRKSDSSYGKSGINFSFGSCDAISPLDPAFEMDEFDMDAMSNMGIAKKNFERNVTYFATNFHVVAGWNKDSDLPIQIKKIFRTYGKKNVVVTVTYNTKLVSVAPREDLALLKVTGIGIPTLKIGDLSKITDYQKKHGYPVKSIGSPYIFEGTESEGKVLYPARDISNRFYQLFDCVADLPLDTERYQTDAGIYPGSSGGSLIGMAGENKNKIIGKPCSGFPKALINFAIPDYTLKKILPQLFNKKVHYSAYTGLIMCEPRTAMRNSINRAVLEKLGLKILYYEIIENMEGALVVGYMDDSPFKPASMNPYARQYGLPKPKEETNEIQHGDVITAVNGAKIRDPYDFIEKLRAVKDGVIEIKLTRFTKSSGDGSEEWIEENITISKDKEDITFTKKKYGILYKSIEAEGMIFRAKIGDQEVPWDTGIKLY